MENDDTTYAALAAVLRSLAKPDFQPLGDAVATTIPGEDTPAKKGLEQELTALLHRMRELETRAASTKSQALPETPNEFVPPTSPFSLPLAGSLPLPSPVLDLDPSDAQAQLEFLQAKCKAHEEEIKENKKKIRELRQETDKVRMVPQVPANEATKIDRLQRELKKSQQANEAFSKALREIGEIVTAGMYLRYTRSGVLG